MTTQPMDNGARAARSRPTSFERFAGTCAVLAGVAGFLYAVAFVVLQNVLLSGLFLMLGGLLSTAVLVAVVVLTALAVLGAVLAPRAGAPGAVPGTPVSASTLAAS